MNTVIKPLEVKFIEVILKVSIAGMIAILIADFIQSGLVFPLATVVDIIILGTLLTSFLLYKANLYTTSVVLVQLVVSGAMFYQSVESVVTINVSMSVVLVIGFSISLLLKGNPKRVMHVFIVTGMTVVFLFQFLQPDRYVRLNSPEALTYWVTYLILYFIISYSTSILKISYDNAIGNLTKANNQLIEKTNQVETKNEELVQSQESLNQMNLHLENLVKERTEKIVLQNQALLNYSYSNAHHVRGPLARIMGLISLARIDRQMENVFVLEKIEEQVIEIDAVIKKINSDLSINSY